jgi:hypothetical protein
MEGGKKDKTRKKKTDRKEKSEDNI